MSNAIKLGDNFYWCIYLDANPCKKKALIITYPYHQWQSVQAGSQFFRNARKEGLNRYANEKRWRSPPSLHSVPWFMSSITAWLQLIHHNNYHIYILRFSGSYSGGIGRRQVTRFPALNDQFVFHFLHGRHPRKVFHERNDFRVLYRQDELASLTESQRRDLHLSPTPKFCRGLSIWKPKNKWKKRFQTKPNLVNQSLTTLFVYDQWIIFKRNDIKRPE